MVVRTHADIAALIDRAALPARVTDRALAVFRRLAEVESALHRRPVDQVHFHEVGGHDAIIDIVGTAAALEVLGVDEVTASAVATGTGTVRSAHGLLPNPSPADGAPARRGADLRPRRRGRAHHAHRRRAAGRAGHLVRAAAGHGGHGLGVRRRRRRAGRAAQLHPGRPRPAREAARRSGPGSRRCLLETNLDDVTGEQLGHAVAAALEAGALDAWVSSVTMKKGRPGHVLHVLTDAAHVERLRHEMRRLTGTLGVRATAVERWPQARTIDQVTVDGVVVRMKVDRAGQARVRRRGARGRRDGAPLHEVASRAEEAWRAASGRPPDPGGHDRPDGQPMFHYDEAMTDLILAACRERLSMDPVALDFGGLVESLDAELAGLMRPEGNDAAGSCELFIDKLATAVVSCDSPRFLSFIPAAPTKASLLFDMFVSCSSLHGTSWLEAAGVVVAENQALGVLAAQAGLPEGAGGCFVAGGSAGQPVRPRWWPATRRATGARATAPARPLIAVSEDAHSSVGKALHVLGVETAGRADARITG